MSRVAESDDLATWGRRRLRDLLCSWQASQDAAAVALFIVDVITYAALIAGVILAPSIWLKILLGAVAGLSISRLFILAHDACHGSFVKRPFWNRIIGRIGFLPSLTPYSLWDVGHNTVHHGFTNLKGKDWVWVPFSKAEFDSLSPWRQRLERIYRTPCCHGLYYCIELWWNRMILPDKQYVSGKWTVYSRDRLVVISFAAAQLALMLGAAVRTGQSPVLLILTGLLLPFALWNATMGMVIYQHHTHPAVAWFDKREEWKSAQVQLRNVVHVLFPGPFNILLHHIMEHAAHHVHSSVPSYNLVDAQAALEDRFPGEMLVQPWSWRFFLDCARRCKLYDYDVHRWMDFNGRPTSEVQRIRPHAAGTSN